MSRYGAKMDQVISQVISQKQVFCFPVYQHDCECDYDIIQQSKNRQCWQLSIIINFLFVKLIWI